LLLRRGGASVRRRTGVRSTGRRALHRRRTETGTRAFACERARCTRAPRSAVSACRVRARALARLALAQHTRLTGYRAAADSAGCAALLGYSPSPRGAQRPARSRHTAGTQHTHARALRAQRPARLQRDWNGAQRCLGG
jgi:hypothetical protein